MGLRIGLAYDRAERVQVATEHELVSASWSLRQVSRVQEALDRLGHQTVRLELGDDPANFICSAREARPDLTFNLVQSNHCSHVARMLEMIDLRYTGSRPLAIDLTTDKGLANDVLAAHGVPAPAHRALHAGDDAAIIDLPFPLLVKPLDTDNSLGLGPDSIVHAPAGLARMAARVVDEYGAALVEEFVEGPELLVSILGNDGSSTVLPIAEADFSRFPPEMPRIYDFESKWEQPGSGAELIVWHARARLTPRQESAVVDASIAACHVLGVRDYARIDLRLDRDGNPKVLEINTNPDVHPRAGTGASALESGRTYDGFVAELVDMAMLAEPKRRPYERIGA